MLPSNLRSILTIGLLILCTPAIAPASDALPTTWSELRQAVHSLAEEERVDDALALMDRAAPQLQDRAFEISNLTMEILFGAGRTDEAMTTWEEGLEEGFFYFVVPRSGTYDSVRTSDRFAKNLARNNGARATAESESEPEYEVITPASYSPEGSYPLVMIIHGGNQSIVKAMGRWDPAAIGDDVIIAYVQSSRRADTKSYRWDLHGVDIYSAPTAQGEVLGLYREIVGEYAVDTGRVTLAGFSQGGNLSLAMATEGTIPARGFIAGCPATRTPVPLETARTAGARGVRGTIFVGANDWTAATVQTTASNFEEAGFPLNHIVMEDKGHEFPDDFDEMLRETVRHILR